MITGFAYLFSEDFICPDVKNALPDRFLIRPLCRTDYDNGFLETVGNLSTVGSLTRTQFETQFDAMVGMNGTYFIVVIEDTSTKKVVATGTVVVEMKL